MARNKGPAFIRTTTFRQTLLSAALFALSSFIILAFIYLDTSSALSRRTDAAIQEELDVLVAYFEDGELEQMDDYILARSVAAGDYTYAFFNRRRRVISGNITVVPDGERDEEGWFDFFYFRQPVEGREVTEKDRRDARGRIVELRAGYGLLVGLDVVEEQRLVERMLQAMLIASALALLLGVAAGVLVSRRFLRRLDAINAAARSIRSGDLTARAPRNFAADELDELSSNFNAMLDRVEELMLRMRSTGDSIAHDLRTPLTRMRNRLEQALLAEGSLADREAALEQAADDTDELLTVFNAILSLSRLESGESRRSVEAIDPAGVLVDLAELYEPVCEDEGLEFDSDIQGDLTVNADRGLLSQATANLLDNAVKYTPEGGAITLRLRRCANGEVEISVTDTGPGIPEEDRQRVTARFVRLDNSRSQPGSGLGLSLVKAIAEAHHGRFLLEEGPGYVDGRGPGLKAAIVLPGAV